MQGVRAAVELVAEAGPDDIIVTIVSGGGSAHLSLPVDDIPLAALRDVTEGLLETDATIETINAVRKHHSQLKGGQLAATASPASVCAIIFSEVIGDRLDTIASGPVSPDATSYDDALAVARSSAVDAPDSVVRHLEHGGCQRQSRDADSS